MVQNTTYSFSPASSLLALPLEDLDRREARYQPLSLSGRAKAALADAEPALQAAERLLQTLTEQDSIGQAFDRVRKNPVFTGKMRPSEAKNLLLDGDDFIEGACRKLATWRKTMQRLADGEGIVTVQNKEHIASDAPLALAIAGNVNVGGHLSIVQLALAELIKINASNAAGYRLMVAEIRRCATVLGDCEYAASIHTLVH